MDNISIIAVREHPEYLERAVDYFSSKWGIAILHIGSMKKMV